MRALYKSLWLPVCLALLCTGAAHAFQFKASDTISGSLDTQFTLGAGMRMVNQNPQPDRRPREEQRREHRHILQRRRRQPELQQVRPLHHVPEDHAGTAVEIPGGFQVHGAGDGAVRLGGVGYPADGTLGRCEKPARPGYPAAGPLGQQGHEPRLPAGPRTVGVPGHQLGGEHLRDRRDQRHQLAGLSEVLDPGDADQGGGPSRPDHQLRVGVGQRSERRGVLPVPLEQEPPASRGHLFFRRGHPGEGEATRCS